MTDKKKPGTPAGGGVKESKCAHCGVTLVNGKPVIVQRKQSGSLSVWVFVVAAVLFSWWLVTPSPEQETVAAGMPAGGGTGGGSDMSGELPEGHPPLDDAGGAMGAMPEDVTAQLKDLRARVAQNPLDTEALKHLGDMYYDIRSYDKSIEYYKSYLAIVPDDPMVQTDIGAMFFAKGEVEHAEEHFLKAIELDDKLYQAYVNLGLVMDVKGEYDEAIRLCEFAMELVDNPSAKEGIAAIIEEFEKHKLEDLD